MAQQGNRRRDAHHRLIDKGEDGKKSNGFRTQMHHMDLVTGKHGVEEIREGGNQSRPQGVGKVPDLGDHPVDGDVGCGPGCRPPALVEDGSKGEEGVGRSGQLVSSVGCIPYKQTRKICTNKGRGVPFLIASVVASTCRADLLLFAGETDVLEGAGLDEPMAKLLTVLPWPYVGGGEADPSWRRTA